MAASIKQLTIEDYDDIVRVWEISGLPIKPLGRENRETFAKELSNPNVAVFGIFVNDRMLSVGMANWDGRRGWINRVAVDPDHRGIGLGGRMIKVCEAWLKAQGALVIAALIEEENSPSMTCFEKEGFACLPHIKYFSKYDSPDS